MNYIDFDTWQQAVKDAHPQEAHKLKFRGRVERGVQTVSAEIPGQDRSYGVWTEGPKGGSGKVLEANMKPQVLKLLPLKWQQKAASGANDCYEAKRDDKADAEEYLSYAKEQLESNGYRVSQSSDSKLTVSKGAEKITLEVRDASIVLTLKGVSMASVIEADLLIDPEEMTATLADLLIDPTEVTADLDELLDDPMEESGAQFDLLDDGDVEDEEPIVQEVTHDDGGVEPADINQNLLIDDLPH